MRRIYKYPVQVTDEFEVLMPVGAMPLSVQMQRGQPCVWALVHEGAQDIYHTFCVVGTGNPVPENAGSYIGTWQDGPFVWHLFEGETP